MTTGGLLLLESVKLYIGIRIKRFMCPKGSAQSSDMWSQMTAVPGDVRGDVDKNLRTKISWRPSFPDFCLSSLVIFLAHGARDGMNRNISPAHVACREVNDSCRQFIHKHVPVTLLERAIRRGAVRCNADSTGRPPSSLSLSFSLFLSLKLARALVRALSLCFPRLSWSLSSTQRNGRRKPHAVQRY